MILHGQVAERAQGRCARAAKGAAQCPHTPGAPKRRLARPKAHARPSG